MSDTLESGAMPGTRTYSLEEVSKHNTACDLWIVVGREVYNLSEFVDEHPGGAKILLPVAGKDATKQFRRYHRDAILGRFRERLKLGTVDGSSERGGRRKSFFGFPFGAKKG